MIDFFTLSEFWLLRVILTGGMILLIGRLAMLTVRQPARRSILGIATVSASLLVIPLSFLPGWWKVSVPVKQESNPTTVLAVGEEPPAVVSNRVAIPEEQEVFAEWVAAKEQTQELQPAAPAKPEVVEPLHAATIPTTAAVSEKANHSVGFWTISTISYALVVSCLLTRLVLGHLSLLKLWRTSHPAPAWALEIFQGLAKPLHSRAQLRLTSASVGPVCFGVVRPGVLIPVSLLANVDQSDLRCVLAHELSHLSHRDPLSGWLLGLARVAYFMCPWLSGLRKEVRLAQEYLADAEAARYKIAPTEYAELLIRMVRSRPVPLGAAGARGTNSELYWRIIMLLQQPVRIDRSCPRGWQLAFGGGLIAVATFVAGLSLQPREAEAAEQKQKDPTAPEPKPAQKADALKEVIDKIKKDLGDDAESVKKLEELLKGLEQIPRPEARVAPLLPPVQPRLPGPMQLPPATDEEVRQLQDQMRKHMEEMMRAVGGRGGLLIGPGGMQPFPGIGGGRLGVRVERPTDVLASQLDLPIGKGLVISDVPAESTAGKIGIKPHDILLEVAGKPVSSQVHEFVQALKDVKEDAAIDIIVMRKGKKETIKSVKLPAVKDFPDALEILPLFRDGGLPLPLPAPALPGGRGAVPPPQIVGPGETVRVEQVNDAFTIFYAKKGVKVTVTGSKDADGKPKAESIEIDDNGKITKAENIEKLPKEYQELARAALKSIK